MKINTVKQSETFRRSYVFRNAETKTILDLTGCEAFSQIRNAPGGELVADATCQVEPTLGRVTVLWTADQTAEIPAGTYVFDVWLKCGTDQKPFTTEQVNIIKTITEISDGD